MATDVQPRMGERDGGAEGEASGSSSLKGPFCCRRVCNNLYYRNRMHWCRKTDESSTNGSIQYMKARDKYELKLTT